jgi:hypothetical protein
MIENSIALVDYDNNIRISEYLYKISRKENKAIKRLGMNARHIGDPHSDIQVNDCKIIGAFVQQLLY